MHTFDLHQRVKVLRNADDIAIGALGTVERVRRDGGAWIALDQRSKVPGVHPFEEKDGDDRATHVLAYPQDCELAKSTAAERRKARRAPDGPVPIEHFGKDHWALLGYISAIWMDGGAPDRRRMRCNPKRHPHLGVAGQHDDGDRYPTQLRGGKVRAAHDDWDCADDLVCAGLLEAVGDDLQRPAYALTEEALPVFRALALHKQGGGSFSTFIWPPPAASNGAHSAQAEAVP
jgi:hypothetical protein